MTEAYKKCTSCAELKFIDEFSPNNRYADGFKRQCRSCESAAWSARKQKYRLEALTAIGELKCKHCGINDIRVLAIDHINGGGKIERDFFNGESKYYKHIAANPAAYQLLCHNCNYLKRINNKEHGGGSPRKVKAIVQDGVVSVVAAGNL